jgi:hypothetical protein
MLEQGKITANESAELLNALAAGARKPAPATVPSRSRRLMWVGAALVLVGFFLPWFKFNAGAMVNKLFGQMQQTMPAGNIGMNVGPHSLQSNGNGMFGGLEMEVSGANIEHGLGWLVLAAVIAATALPYVVPDMSGKKLHFISGMCLFVGLLVLLNTLKNGLQWGSIGIGIILCLAGYGASIMGAVHEWKSFKATQN